MGKSIGEALKHARLWLMEKYGDTALIWASYMLYGDPGDYLVIPEEKKGFKKFVTPKNLSLLGIVFIILISIALHQIFRLKEEVPISALNIPSLKNVYYVKEGGAVNKYDEYNILSRNMALSKKSDHSSMQSKYQGSSYAFDNNLGTRWASLFSDPQWIYVDLGESVPIGYIKLKWQMASARSYDIQVSNDAKKWKTVWRTSNGGGP
ncbi:MAG: discoidin domain-containing protein, partial [Candidatus Omnitrophica bacterium]|nr:discoidin domain-containing protein [Candidatus Omnitrophota bacterium]